jgi:hypothetical protein
MWAVPIAGQTAPGKTTTIHYDSFGKGYTLEDYESRWNNPYGLGEMTIEDTRSFARGRFSIDAAPFQTGIDFSVFDHIKYLAISDRSFDVPQRGSVMFSADIAAQVPGTEQGHVIRGVYGPPGCAEDPTCAAGARPYSAELLRGQQAGATLHMIDFATGQLFDWFVAGDTAFMLVERLPSSITGSPTPAGLDKMYTQIVKEVSIDPNVAHTVGIRYTRNSNDAFAEFFLDGVVVATVNRVGVPLDVQGAPYTGVYPSLGQGELLKDQVNSVVIGHGVFSLLDEFPFQYNWDSDGAPYSVSIPVSERLFGQGAIANFDNFNVKIRKDG